MKTIQQLLVLSTMLTLTRPASAAVPSTINYQGRLTNATGVPLPGDRAMSVKIYASATLGALLYSEAMGNVSVDENGVYGFQFGANGIGAPASFASALVVSNEHWLELIVDGVAQAPRQKLQAVPFALMAKGLPDGTVTTSMIANGALDFNGLSPGVMASLAAGTVTTWGSITGSISTQPDLTSALGLKVDLAQVSTTGGANKIPQLNANGDWLTSNNFNNLPELQMGPGGNIYMPDLRGLQWYKRNGTLSGYRIFPWETHDGSGGELLIESPFRIALLPHGPIQIGVGDPTRYGTVMQFNTGVPSAGDPIRQSVGIEFLTKGWNGGAVVSKRMGMQAIPESAANAAPTLKFFANASVNGSAGGGGGTVIGNMEGTEIGSMGQEGFWEPGKAPAFQTVTWATPTTTQTVSKFKSVQVGSLVMAGPTTLAFSGVLPGMRGSLYVYQDSAGSKVLTLPPGSIFPPGAVLSTGANEIDRLQWEYDGSNYYWTITKGLQITLDADAQTYLTQNVAITAYSQRLLVNNLVLSLKSAGLWTRFDGIYPFMGGTATANSQDLKNTYDITWSGTPTHNSSGVTGDPGTSAYGNTGMNWNTIGSRQNNASAYIYSRTAAPTDNGMWVGATSASTYARIGRRDGILKGDGPNSNTNGDLNWGINAGRFRGHFTMNRSTSTANQFRFLEYGQPIAAPANSTTTSSAVNSNLFLLASNNNGSAGDFSNINLGFAALGQSLTPTEWDAFFAIVDIFQAALGRANP